MLVVDDAGVAAIAERVARAPLVAFDLEFDTKDHLVPALCLVQVACVQALDAEDEPFVALVDPLAVEPRVLVEALAAHPTVVAHAPRQDLGVLYARYPGLEFPGLVDTQLMAAFAGHGDQIGLASLVAELAGAKLSKDQQWTDWAKRPLSDSQLRYAAADVLYLPGIFATLAARLGPRVGWVRDETAQISRDARAFVERVPEDAWREIGGVHRMEGKELGAVSVLAAWRQRTAVAIDRPLGHVLPDKSLIELAKQRPGDADGVRAIRGLPERARKEAEALAQMIADAPAIERERHRAPSVRAQRWSEALIAIANVVADEAGIAARLLATRSDAEGFARAVDERGLDAAELSGWRAEVLLPAWRGWLEGHLAIVANTSSPHGISLAKT